MFDIETTGLSPNNSFTYIIGINVPTGDGWDIIQLFNDDGRSEAEMIREFQSIISGYDILMQFNGDRFDIPYIHKRMDFITSRFSIHIADYLSTVQSFDLMKCIRPYKYALGLPNIKQKTIEKYLGINRVDMYNGGQLIDVYLNYLTMKDEHSRQLVLRHNRDDMEGMLYLCEILGIDQLGSGLIDYAGLDIRQINDRLYLFIEAGLRNALIHPIMTSCKGISIEAEQDRVSLRIPIFEGSLGFYTGDREKDLAGLRDGYYVSTISDYHGRAAVYRERARSRDAYIMLDDTFLGNNELINEYISHLAGKLLHYNGK